MTTTNKKVKKVTIKDYQSNISFLFRGISEDEWFGHETMITSDDIMPEIWDNCEEWATEEYSEIAEEMAEHGYSFTDEQKDEIVNALVRCASHLFE